MNDYLGLETRYLLPIVGAELASARRPMNLGGGKVRFPAILK